MNPRLILLFPALLAMALLAREGHAAPKKAREVAPSFVLPLACTPGEDCWVMNYMDTGPADDGVATDPFCGARSYEKNKGTVFALRDIPQMERGVNVVAARDGKVLKVRAAEPDRLATEEELKQTQKDQKECGNAVLIEHAKDLQTVYCHLKRGSITVKPGDTVKAGNAIGQVGLSGYTQFPQLHFGITWKGNVVDPFTGLTATDACGTPKKPLWDSSVTLGYQPVEFYNAGFSGVMPSLRNIDAGHGRQSTLPTTTSLVAFWSVIFGVQKGDEIKMTITTPDGTVLAERAITQTENATRQLYYTGRKIAEGRLPAGIYTGKTTLKRAMKDGSVKEISIDRTVNIQGE